MSKTEELPSEYKQEEYKGPRKGAIIMNDGDQRNEGTGGQKDRGYRGGNRPFRQPMEGRPPRVEADPNSNYKLYYENDPYFYLNILQEEDPGETGQEFKLQLFKMIDFQGSESCPIDAFGF
jgi:hypothetical protein